MGKANLNVRWTIEVKNKAGIVSFKKSGQSKSLLRAFMFWLQSKFTITATGGIATAWTTADIGDISRTLPWTSNLNEGTYGFFGALANQSDTGLRIGTGTAVVSPVDFELATKIVHGTGPYLMVYGTQTLEAVAIVGNVSSFRVSRPFTNNSGSTITVTEIGAAFDQKDNGNVERFILYLRDVLASGVDVPDGSTFTLRYTFSVTA